MLAVTVPFLEKFACVVAGNIIGISRHSDYWEYHYRLIAAKAPWKTT